jgi:hypothetical protein
MASRHLGRAESTDVKLTDTPGKMRPMLAYRIATIKQNCPPQAKILLKKRYCNALGVISVFKTRGKCRLLASSLEHGERDPRNPCPIDFVRAHITLLSLSPHHLCIDSTNSLFATVSTSSRIRYWTTLAFKPVWKRFQTCTAQRK